MTIRPEPFTRAETDPVVHFDLAMLQQVDDVLSRLALDLGITKGEAVLRGIALLKAAADARRDGKAIGATSNASGLDTEFVGF